MQRWSPTCGYWHIHMCNQVRKSFRDLSHLPGSYFWVTDSILREECTSYFWIHVLHGSFFGDIQVLASQLVFVLAWHVCYLEISFSLWLLYSLRFRRLFWVYTTWDIQCQFFLKPPQVFLVCHPWQPLPPNWENLHDVPSLYTEEKDDNMTFPSLGRMFHGMCA